MAVRVLWIILGIISILAGLLALANPRAATLTAEQLAGWAFLILGVLQFIAIFQQRDWSGRIWSLLLAAAFTILGLSLLANPLAGIVSLTITAAVMFLFTGIAKIVMSFSLRDTGAFWPVMLSGAVSLLLAVMIFANFPASVASILGILLAVELISSGASMIALSSVVDRVA